MLFLLLGPENLNIPQLCFLLAYDVNKLFFNLEKQHQNLRKKPIEKNKKNLKELVPRPKLPSVIFEPGPNQSGFGSF